MSARDVHISRLAEHPENIRKHIGDIAELTASVRAHGILQPLVVQPHPQRDRCYVVIAGHRRLAAAKRAGLETVPVIVRDMPKPTKAIEVMLVENCQRSDLSSVEKAEAMGRLRDHGYTASAIARATGLTISTVSYYLSLLELDESSRAQVKAGLVSVGDAVKAVRKARKARRGGATGRPVQAERPWFTGRHRLAASARRMCDHTRRPLIGNVACGQCWEQAIRDDEQERATPEPDPERLTARQERMQVVASLKMNDAATPVPGTVTAREAAERLGVTPRTIERYKRDLALAEDGGAA